MADLWKMLLEKEDQQVSFELYQSLAARTANKYLEYEKRLAVATLGLTGEAGEFAELVKKFMGHGHKLDKTMVKKELGDVLWYVSELCTIMGFHLEDVARGNIGKLYARYPEGFDSLRSINKDESNE